MPCPHCKITIIKRSNNESAVSAAAYQSGEKLFSEYDQEQKYYPYKNEVTHKEIMLPPHVPPEFADRNTLWNSAEAQEKQWNFSTAHFSPATAARMVSYSGIFWFSMLNAPLLFDSPIIAQRRGFCYPYPRSVPFSRSGCLSACKMLSMFCLIISYSRTFFFSFP